MRFLANENIPRGVVNALRATAHDVTWVAEDAPSTSDTDVLERARRESRVLGYLLARLLHLRARRADAPVASPEHLIEALGRIRRATIARSASAKGSLRIST